MAIRQANSGVGPVKFGRWMQRSKKRGDRWRQGPSKKCHGAVANDPDASMREHSDQFESQSTSRSLPSYVCRARKAAMSQAGGDSQPALPRKSTKVWMIAAAEKTRGAIASQCRIHRRQS